VIDLLSDQRVPSELVRAIDRRIDLALERALPRVRYGVVDSIDTANRTVGVLLAGDLVETLGYVYGALQPAVGQFVRVVALPTGDRYVDDGLGGLGAGLTPAARIGRGVSRASGTQNISHDTITVVTYDTAVWTEPATTHSSGSTIVTLPGLYVVSLGFEWPSNATGNWRLLGIGVANGSAPTTWGGWANVAQHAYAINPDPGLATGTRRLRGTWVVPLVADDHVAGFAYQNSGGTLAIAAAEMTLARVAA
jgi:hypothetical protein